MIFFSKNNNNSKADRSRLSQREKMSKMSRYGQGLVATQGSLRIKPVAAAWLKYIYPEGKGGTHIVLPDLGRGATIPYNDA